MNSFFSIDDEYESELRKAGIDKQEQTRKTKYVAREPELQRMASSSLTEWYRRDGLRAHTHEHVGDNVNVYGLLILQHPEDQWADHAFQAAATENITILMPCHTMPQHAVPCRTMLCCAVPCHAITMCHTTRCHAVLCCIPAASSTRRHISPRNERTYHA